jgi:hypothetical protein
VGFIYGRRFSSRQEELNGQYSFIREEGKDDGKAEV